MPGRHHAQLGSPTALAAAPAGHKEHADADGPADPRGQPVGTVTAGTSGERPKQTVAPAAVSAHV